MCSLCLCILLCNRAQWKNSVTEWFTLYKYIWNKNKKLNKLYHRQATAVPVGNRIRPDLWMAVYPTGQYTSSGLLELNTKQNTCHHLILLLRYEGLSVFSRKCIHHSHFCKVYSRYLGWTHAETGMLLLRWIIESRNLGNVSHKQGKVTVNLWSDPHNQQYEFGDVFCCHHHYIITYLCEKVDPLRNTITHHMYSPNIVDMSRIFLSRFVTQIFVASKYLMVRSIMCVFIRLYLFTTDFLLWIGRPLRFLIASYHDMAVTLMCNEKQSQHGQQSILVFQWRLTNENVNA